MIDINDEQENTGLPPPPPPLYDHPHLRQRNNTTRRNNDHLADHHHPLSDQSTTNALSPPSAEQQDLSDSHEQPSQEENIIRNPSEPEGHQEETDQEPCAEKPAEATKQAEDNEEADEEALCRICLSGRDDADPSLGRFIQPCLCRGTMAFIHVGCLQRWRITSPSPKSFYRCDQCGYRYKLRRAKIAGLAENPAILGGVTFMVFFILVIVSGFISSWLLESYSQITTIESHWDTGLGPFSYDSTGKIVGEVVGEAVRVLNSKLHVDDSRSSRKAATTPVRRSKLVTQSQSSSEVSKLKPIESAESEEHTYRYVRSKGRKNGQDASPDQPLAVYSTRPSTRANPAGQSSTTGPREDEEADEEAGEPGNIIHSILSTVFSKLEALIKHTIKGLAFIGVMSFFQLAMSVTLFSPWNFGIRNSVLRMMRSGSSSRSSAGRAAADPNGIGSLLILIFVLLGVLKAIQSVWKFVRKSSQWALRKIEDGVLDVRTT
ncbi:hypothetical protein PTTG_04943 [Puccinia triticina 1-1 BBBD Race 1]|uniref:RING-CH-type domain-containing protein n=2 Tax=Puccinia triticina TaxID=208348 RepID=A0A180GJ43_PUCT1|nr:uncharacterized protein PtA15_3A406 [Puccinia triticina]OAV92797.1 hypothetical protein PTTG_04943 [Puccinia triticina 1-1 BBBD Race 1]WAQ83040.1 hypothetical protein PtA15_3A406 [Puccinia triticina]WAR53874.1 hypothetical protein PtB15_3B383 [Puccinia triticina]